MTIQVMTTNPLRVGVVGLGKMGLLHAGILNSLDGSKLVAVCDSNSALLRLVSQVVPRVRIHTDFSDMIAKNELDLVVIATPVFLHRPMVEMATAANLSIMVEKPLAMNAHECAKLLATERRTSMVAYCRRFMSTYRYLKEVIDSTQMGGVSHFCSQLYVSQVHRKQKGWQYDSSRSGGGVVMDLGCHAFDLFHYLFGRIDTINARGESYFTKGIEDTATIQMHFARGLTGSLGLSWSANGYRLPELFMEVQFDNGAIKVTEKYVQIDSTVETARIQKGRTILRKQQLGASVPLNIAGPEYTLENMHLLECIVESREPLCNFRESATANFAIDAVYESMSSGKEVRVGQYEP